MKRTIFDIGCDQGYGSERSPEDELPPILTIPYQVTEQQVREQYTAAIVSVATPQQQQQQQHNHHHHHQHQPPTAAKQQHQVKWQDEIHESDFNFITDGE